MNLMMIFKNGYISGSQPGGNQPPRGEIEFFERLRPN